MDIDFCLGLFVGCSNACALPLEGANRPAIATHELGIQVKAAPHLPQAVPHGTLGEAHRGVSE